jgi:hypothetical protein
VNGLDGSLAKASVEADRPHLVEPASAAPLNRRNAA